MADEILDELRAKSELVNHLAKEVDWKNGRLGYMEKRCDLLSAEISKMKEEKDKQNQAYVQEIRRLHFTACEYDKLHRELDSKIKEFERKAKEVEQREALIEEREAHIEEREGQIEEREAQIEERQAQIEVRQAQIEDREGQIEEREGQIEVREVQIEEREAQNEERQAQIEDRRAQIELQQKELSQLKVKRKAKMMLGNFPGLEHKPRGDTLTIEWKTNDLSQELDDKTDEMESLLDLNQVLILKEHKSNHELQEARKVLIEALDEYWGNHRKQALIGIKRLGELDQKPFRDLCVQKKVPATERAMRSAELCSFWQEHISNSEWHPFKNSLVDGKLRVVIDEDDEKLKELKLEFGDKVYDAVVTAVMEINEYNASGRYPVRELWNFEEGKKASLTEVILYILKQWKSLKSFKKRRS